MIPIPRISLRTAAEIILGGLLVLALLCQTIRIEGFKVWPLHFHGLLEQLDDAKKLAADTQAAFERTVADYRAKAEQARRADLANLNRVKAEQTHINKETSDAYEVRIAGARDRARRLQQQADAAAANPRSGGSPSVSGVPAAPGSAPQAAEQGRLSRPDALTATEQAIQLDELIKWVRRQAAIAVNGQASPQN